ncbi:MAG: hypothetical protein V1720_17145 [bacterium]
MKMQEEGNGTTYNNIQTLVHESFIHAQLWALDYQKDQKYDDSEIPNGVYYYRYSIHHPYAKKFPNSYFNKNGIPLMEKMNEIYKIHKNSEEVKNAMYDFID